jgi:hypothetical protein
MLRRAAISVTLKPVEITMISAGVIAVEATMPSRAK